MAPIFDSDLSEERYEQAEWQNYELWEKLEVRLRRKNRLWITGAILLFLLLASIPIVVSDWPRWGAMLAVRRLGECVSQMKKDAALIHYPMRLRFEGDSLGYVIEKLDRCQSPASIEKIRTGSLASGSDAGAYRLLTPEEGSSHSLSGLLEEFCYDPGAENSVSGGFAIGSVKDLTRNVSEQRLDRIAVLYLSGATAEVSFD